MAFRDLDEFLVVKPIELPIRGKVYSFPGPGDISARSGLLLQRILMADEEDDGDAEAVVLSDAEDEALRKEILGGLEDEMVADGLTFAHIRVAYFTLIACHLQGVEAGMIVWNNQGEAIAPNREARRKTAAKSAGSRGSRAGSPAPKAKAARPGGKSSSAGTSSKPT